VELPIEVAPAQLQMMWHERKLRDPSHEWMRSQIAERCHQLFFD
jgi:DNA-binding transcriptional LysR family regulator